MLFKFVICYSVTLKAIFLTMPILFSLLRLLVHKGSRKEENVYVRGTQGLLYIVRFTVQCMANSNNEGSQQATKAYLWPLYGRKKGLLQYVRYSALDYLDPTMHSNFLLSHIISSWVTTTTASMYVQRFSKFRKRKL